MKIKVIDLINLIYEKKAPKKIVWEDKVWEYEQDQYLCKDYDVDIDDYGANIWNGYNFNILNDEVTILDDEVEILEDTPKGIEKIMATSLKGIDNLDEKIEIAHIDTISAIDKINELINVVNEMSNKE